MITGISIENFKAFRKRIDLELAPITLLFGRNSAGKSTVLQGLDYARAVVADADRNGGGDAQVGGFANVANCHNMDRDVRIGLRIKPTLPDIAQFFLQSAKWDPYSGSADEVTVTDDLGSLADAAAIVGEGVSTADDSVFEIEWDQESMLSAEFTVEFALAWDQSAAAPYLKQWQVAVDEQVQFAIDATPRRRPLLWTDFTAAGGLYSDRLRYVMSRWARPADDIGKSPNDARSIVNRARGYYCLNEGRDALPGAFLDLDLGQRPIRNSAVLASIYSEFGHFVSSSRNVPAHYLKAMRHIGPIRVLPQRGLVDFGWPSAEQWYDGAAAWALLQRDPALAVDKVGRALSKLKTGFAIQALEVGALDEPGWAELMLHQLQMDPDDRQMLPTLLERVSRAQRYQAFRLVDEANNLVVHPRDVGVGISQLIPVVAAAVSQTEPHADGSRAQIGLVTIEQPELHVHPAVQAELADLFISTIRDTTSNGDPDAPEFTGRQYLIETHSEHLLLRLRRRIRETTENPDVPVDRRLRPEDIAIYYFDNVDGEVSVTRIRVDEDGDFLDRWPHGFFPERIQEF